MSACEISMRKQVKWIPYPENYSWNTSFWHLKSTEHVHSWGGALHHFLSLLVPSCYKDYGSLWCISKLFCQWAALQTAAVPTFLVVSFPFHTQPKYIHFLSEFPRGNFNLWPSVVVLERDSSGQLQWFKCLSATYGILVGLFLLCTIPDWKEKFFFCSAVFMRVAVQKSLWTFRISVENKQINHPRYYLLLFGSVPAQFFQMPNCHTCLYWSMQIPKGSL